MYVIVNPATKAIVTVSPTGRTQYGTIAGAKRSLAAYQKRLNARLEENPLNGMAAKNYDASLTFITVDLDTYNKTMRATKVVKNLMTGADVVIDVNTPRSCDPSSELYWSM